MTEEAKSHPEFPGFGEVFAAVNKSFDVNDQSVNQQSFLTYEYLRKWFQSLTIDSTGIIDIRDLIMDLCKRITEIIQGIPPYYAYGDNEAGCYMAAMLHDIDTIVDSIHSYVSNGQ
jgi:hypothetical protein